ncbi:MAG TPA: hypothetical protein VLI04_01995 [Nocardioidaceae bacterium]|nr:hypothetical protein [Nocardioidaceae bacterium]
MTAYAVVHYLLRQHKGAALERTCVECAAPARHWAYDQNDVFARVDNETGQVFSVNFDHYQPMCQRCHQRLDAAFECPPREPAKCGTLSGYNVHLRNSEAPCAACVDVRREYHRAYNAKAAS